MSIEQDIADLQLRLQKLERSQQCNLPSGGATQVASMKLLLFSGVSHACRLPADKNLVITVNFWGDKEQNLLVEIPNQPPVYIRNSIEGTRTNEGRPLEFVANYTIGAIASDRTIIFRGQSKDCYVGSNCGNQPWWDAVLYRVYRESETGFDVSWDEGNQPPRYDHIRATARVA
jgi:hypothetical protein